MDSSYHLIGTGIVIIICTTMMCIISILLEAKRKKNCDNVYKYCADGMVDDVRSLLQRNNININQKYCNYGGTLLHEACVYGHIEVVKLLIDYGADINVLNNRNETALFLSCWEGHYNIVKLLLDNNADIFVKSNNKSCLYMACSNGHYDIVKLLIDSINTHHLLKQDIVADNDCGLSCLQIACLCNYADIVKLLLDNMNNNYLDNQDYNDPHDTCLFLACSNGNTDVVKLLMDEEVSMDDRTGCACLHMACLMGYYDVIKLLLKYGAHYREDKKSIIDLSLMDIHSGDARYDNIMDIQKKEIDKRLYIISLIVQSDVMKHYILKHVDIYG